MNVIRSLVSVVTALAFFAQTTGLAYAQDAQPAPFTPAQPVPLPSAAPAPIPPAPTTAPPPAPVAPAPPPGFGGAPQPYTPQPYAPSPGYAPARPGGDTVYLKDGGLLRGTLVEMLPNDHATIQLLTGQTATVEWGRIDHIERGSLQAPPIAPFGAPPQRERRHRPSGLEPTAVVHLDADAGIVLQSVSPGTGRWAVVCAAPCDAALPIDREYRVTGDGVRPSRSFGIHASPGQHVTIGVSPASTAGRSAGVALASVGGAAIVIGLIVLVYGALGACEQTDAFGDCIQSQSDSGVETAGAVISLAGVALAIGGIALVAVNARTTTTQSTSALLTPPERPETAWLRAPVWRDGTRQSAAAPRPMGFPLLSRSF